MPLYIQADPDLGSSHPRPPDTNPQDSRLHPLEEGRDQGPGTLRPARPIPRPTATPAPPSRTRDSFDPLPTSTVEHRKVRLFVPATRRPPKARPSPKRPCQGTRSRAPGARRPETAKRGTP